MKGSHTNDEGHVGHFAAVQKFQRTILEKEAVCTWYSWHGQVLERCMSRQTNHLGNTGTHDVACTRGRHVVRSGGQLIRRDGAQASQSIICARTSYVVNDEVVHTLQFGDVSGRHRRTRAHDTGAEEALLISSIGDQLREDRDGSSALAPAMSGNVSAIAVVYLEYGMTTYIVTFVGSPPKDEMCLLTQRRAARSLRSRIALVRECGGKRYVSTYDLAGPSYQPLRSSPRFLQGSQRC